jgi:hypothetical protein
MAVWQCSVVFIPKLWAVENRYDPTSLYDADGYYDTTTAWKENQPHPEFINKLSSVLSPAKSWDKDLLFWGNEKENDIQVWYENKLVDGIHIRLDLNKNLYELIAKLIKIANELDCIFFFPEQRIFTEANEIEFKKTLKNSRAAKFVIDPEEFLKDL